MINKAYLGATPVLSPGCYIAENATLVGSVDIRAGASIWYGAVLRADYSSIAIGENTNVQDNAVLHCDKDTPVIVGKGVTVGHSALLHGCIVQDNCMIGMGATLLNNCEIGRNCIVAAGSLVTQGTVIPAGSLVMGSPAKVKRPLTPEEIEEIEDSARHYRENAAQHFAAV